MHTARRTFGLLLVGAISVAGCVAQPGSVPETTNGVMTPAPTATTTFDRGGASPVVIPSLTPISSDEAWAKLIPGDPAAVSYRSLAAIVRDADAVVIAMPLELTKGPQFTDEYGNVVYLATVTMKVERLLHGSVQAAVPGTVVVRTWLGVGDPGSSDFGAEFAQLAAAQPSGRAVLFLANMAAYNDRMGGSPDHPSADPLAYQILGGQGFLREVNGKAQPPDLPEAALSVMAGRWQLEARGRPFHAVVLEIEAAKP